MPRSLKQKRDVLWREQRGRCFYCNRQVRKDDATLEHITPKMLQGSNRYINLAMCCPECNQAKGQEMADLLRDVGYHEAVIQQDQDRETGWRPFANLQAMPSTS